MTAPTQPTIGYEPKPPPRPRLDFIRDDIAYILPMAAFLLLTQVGSSWPSLYPASYVAKTLLVPVLLALLWKKYTPIRWDYWWLGVIFGVLGIVQWVGMEKLLLHFWPNYLRLSAEPFDPTKAFDSPWAMWGFIAVRWAGASLVVPVMEELFWRDFAWRSIIAPNDFKLARVGEWDAKALIVVALIFSVVHIQWMTAIAWGLLVGWLLVMTKSLGACIIMHGVTNFLLGAYVLYSHFYRGRDEWYFW